MPAYRISAAAVQDIAQLLAYTQDRFGETARRRYQALLVVALRDIASDPKRLGSVARPELGTDIRRYHLRHSTRRAHTLNGIMRQPRHFQLYRSTRPDLIGIGRVLHDGMEVERHLPGQYGDE